MKSEKNFIYFLVHPNEFKRFIEYSVGESVEYDLVLEKLLNMGFKITHVFNKETESVESTDEGTPINGFPL